MHVCPGCRRHVRCECVDQRDTHATGSHECRDCSRWADHQDQLNHAANTHPTQFHAGPDPYAYLGLVDEAEASPYD